MPETSHIDEATQQRSDFASPGLLRCVLAIACLAVLGAQAAVPHLHLAPAHESEVCSGHLDDHGAPDLEHGQGCVQFCSTKRSRPPEEQASATVALRENEPLRAPTSETRVLPRSLARASAAPRAPPQLVNG